MNLNASGRINDVKTYYLEIMKLRSKFNEFSFCFLILYFFFFRFPFLKAIMNKVRVLGCQPFQLSLLILKIATDRFYMFRLKI